MKFLKAMAAVGFAFYLQSCHWLFQSHAKSLPPPSVGDISRYSSDAVELEDIRDFFKRVFGGTEDDYLTRWEDLIVFQEGSVPEDRIPYLDSWYPERNGGTNINGALNKYDQAYYSGVSTAAKWEFENNSRQPPEFPSWYGHCNGTSVTVSRFQPPQNSVSRPVGCEIDPNINCVLFQPEDIRALLSEINMNAKAKFISGNRCRLSEEELASRPAIRTNPLVMDECDDVNPASFHIGLINFLARKKQPVVFDENRDLQVWNYPIYNFNYTAEGPLDEEEAVARLGLDIDEWIFNPNIDQFYFIRLNLTYRRAIAGFDGAGTRPPGQTKQYTYILEVDSDGDVVGGEWAGESRSDHPDFLWMPFEPDEPTGSSARGNPHVSNDEVIRIWAESVGFDPEKPFRDKPANSYDVRFFPVSDDDWGDVKGYYRLVLDGRTTGAVFRDKPVHLRVLVADPLKQNASVDIYLNGKSLGRHQPKDGRIDLDFDSPSGVNYLNFSWSATGISSKELDWEFRYFAM